MESTGVPINYGLEDTLSLQYIHTISYWAILLIDRLNLADMAI